MINNDDLLNEMVSNFDEDFTKGLVERMQKLKGSFQMMEVQNT